METAVIESVYPLDFRQVDAEELGRCLKLRHSMEIIGMRRVGISNFLRFFLSHKETSTVYIKDDKKHLFIAVDLNDLVEREVYPFWTLTLKRIVDAVDQSEEINQEVKTRIQSLFLGSIQTQDLFMLIDSVRRALVTLVEHDIYPSLFFLRFDRMQEAFTVAFFDNLKGLRDAASEKVAYIFTSYRSLNDLYSAAKPSLSSLSQTYYFKPATHKDMAIIYSTYKKRYALLLTAKFEEELFTIVGGNVQYMQLAMIILNEMRNNKDVNGENLLNILINDERIILQSEELWESLTLDEKKVLMAVAKGDEVKHGMAKYLWDTGFISSVGSKVSIFSPLLTHYLLHNEKQEQQKADAVHLTRKENLLFELLRFSLGEICERDKIIEKVWPEYKEFGVSDWAIDRLVARVRVKLRKQKSQYEIVTVRTRGYKLSTVS